MCLHGTVVSLVRTPCMTLPRMGYCANPKLVRRFRCEDSNTKVAWSRATNKVKLPGALLNQLSSLRYVLTTVSRLRWQSGWGVVTGTLVVRNVLADGKAEEYSIALRVRLGVRSVMRRMSAE